MAISKQALLGMIEVDPETDELHVAYADEAEGTVVTFTPSRYTYANIIDLVYDLNASTSEGYIYLTSEVAGSNSNDGFFVKVGVEGETLLGVGGDLLNLLGGSFTLSGESATFTNRPLNTWIPRYRSNDGNWFAVESGSVIKGSIGVAGNLSGIAYTARQKKSFEWPFVSRKNAFIGSITTAEEERSFEAVVNGACSNVLEYEGSGNIYCKGLYYIHSISDYTGSASNLTDYWDDGNPNDEIYVFVSCKPVNPGGQSNESVNTYYDIGLTVTTGTAPDWTAQDL